MQKRHYIIKTYLKAILVLIAPQLAFLALIAHHFPSDDFWTWFFRIAAQVTTYVGFLAGLAQLLGTTLGQWIGWDVLRILEAFDATTRRTLYSIQDRLPVLDERLERSETLEVLARLQRGDPVRIEGESGSGKSGIAAAVVRQFRDDGTPTLFLDSRNYRSIVSTFGELRDYIEVAYPVRDCLERVAKRVGDCVLVVDQLDSVVDTPALQVSTELLAVVAALGNVEVVAASCPLDVSEYDPVRHFELVVSGLLDRTRVAALLQDLGITDPPESVLALSENLLCLSLVADLSTQLDIEQMEGEVALFEEYREDLCGREGVEFAIQVGELAYQSFLAGSMDFHRSRIPEDVFLGMQRHKLITPTGHDRYRFRHEQLWYYFYADTVIQKDLHPVQIVSQVAGRHVEGALVWTLRLLAHRRFPQVRDFLGAALGDDGGLYFYEKAALLDEIQTWPDIASYPTAVEAVLSALSQNDGLERYFFRHLAEGRNPNWFAPLRDAGVLTDPPEPIERGDKTVYPSWAAGSYLVALAPQLPEAILETAKHIHTRNHIVLHHLVRAAETMSPEYAAQMVPLVVGWADQGMRVGEDVISLAVYLAQEEQWEAGLRLVDLILSPEKKQVPEEAKKTPFFTPTAVSKADRYFVQEFVDRGLGLLLEHHSLETLQVVERNLLLALEIEDRENRDLSWIWRPAIEPHEQNLSIPGIKDLLIRAAAQALDAAINNEVVEAWEVLRAYLAHILSVFRRLAIHAIRRNPNRCPDLLRLLLTDQRYLEDEATYHEYWMLVRDTYPTLQANIQAVFVNLLLSKLPTESTESAQCRRQRCWVLRRLWAIKGFLSAKEHVSLLRDLASECGEPEHPSFLHYSKVSWGSVSPKASEQLGKMLPEEILHELRKGLPPTGFDEPTQEGLANALRASIANTPHPFVSIAPELFEPGIIPPVCTDHAVWGFREAWEAGHEFEWKPVLKLCEKVSRTSETATEDGEPPDIAPGYWMTTYAGARSAVADLLESAVVQDERAVPPALLNRVRDILLVLADDVNPSAQYERKWRSDRPSGVLDLALNVIRGKAVEALVRYALHVARTHPTKRESGGFSASGSRLESKVEEKLTDKLDKQVDPSLAVHSLFGKYLPSLDYLDEDWTLAHLDDIFPRQSAMLDYWEAAWDGYLLGGQLFGYLYDLLKPYYRFAIEQLALGAKGRAGSEFSRRRLGQHLAALYWRGVETLADDDSLLHLFLDSAPDEVRAAFVDSLGSAMAEVEPSANSQEWQRLKTLWRARFRFANDTNQQTGSLGNLHAELAAFARWVPSIPETLDGLYPEIKLSLRLADNPLVVKVVDFLAETVNDNVGIAVALLEEVVEQDRGHWFLIAQRDQVYEILSSAMKSEDLEIQSDAVRVINLFGERGNERYRELLDIR